MKIIDFESHFYTREFTGVFTPTLVKRIEEELPQGAHFTLLEELLDLGQGRIDAMDRAGIDQMVLSVSSGIEYLQGQGAVETARAVNDRLFRAMREYPGRFLGLATLPVHDVEASVRELDRCVEELGFCGWNTFSNYGPYLRLDDRRFFPILQEAERLKALLYLHPVEPLIPDLVGYGKQLNGGLGYHVDTQITLVRMICAGIFDRLPGLKVLIGHLGEGLPFYLDRIDAKTPEPKLRSPAVNQQPLRFYFRHNILATISGNYSQPAFRCACDVLGTDRLLFASDYPYESLTQTMQFWDSLPLSREDREKIAFRNGEQICRIGKED